MKIAHVGIGSLRIPAKMMGGIEGEEEGDIPSLSKLFLKKGTS